VATRAPRRRRSTRTGPYKRDVSDVTIAYMLRGMAKEMRGLKSGSGMSHVELIRDGVRDPGTQSHEGYGETAGREVLQLLCQLINRKELWNDGTLMFSWVQLDAYCAAVAAADPTSAGSLGPTGNPDRDTGVLGTLDTPARPLTDLEKSELSQYALVDPETGAGRVFNENVDYNGDGYVATDLDVQAWDQQAKAEGYIKLTRL